MARRKQRWDVGDQFTVRLPDGTAALGQVVGREAEVLNSVTCALFSIRCETDSPAPSPALDDLISCVFTTADLLDRGVWEVIGRSELVVPTHLLPFEHTRMQGWVGAKVYGSANVAQFLAAYHCLARWDDWADPAYLDRLLIAPDKKPANVLRKRAEPHLSIPDTRQRDEPSGANG
jgi:hypothetical protein